MFQISATTLQPSDKDKVELESLNSNNLNTYSNDSFLIEVEMPTQRLETKEDDYRLEMGESLEKFCCEDETITNRPANMRSKKRLLLASPYFKNVEKTKEVNDTSTNDVLSVNEYLKYKRSQEEEEILNENSNFVRIAQKLK